MMKMEKPNLNRMYEAFIKIGLPGDFSVERAIHMIRFELYPLITQLKSDEIINWYSFLIHNRRSGVPTTEDDENFYFHVRFGLKEEVDSKDLNNSLPQDCLDIEGKKIRKITPRTIRGIEKSLLENEEIEEAWRIIGEQTEWLINMLNIYKEDVEIAPNQVEQFLHFYSNMTGLSKMAIFQIKCPYCEHVLLLQKEIFFMRQ